MHPLKKKSLSSVKLTSATSKMARTLGGFDLILFGLGALVGTGVFALTGSIAAQYAGPAVTISYLIAGVTCIFIALVYTELATMLPTSGSIYTYSYVAFGEMFAWIMASIIVLELGFSSATVASAWSSYVVGILDSMNINISHKLTHVPSEGGIIDLPALLIVIIVGSVLYLGMRDSKILNNILVFIKIGAILIFIIFAAPHVDFQKNWSKFTPNGFDDVLVGASILFFAFSGFGILATTVEECKDPVKDITIGIIGSLILATTLYIVVAAVLTGVVNYTNLNATNSLAYALSINGSNIGSIVVATGAICGMTTVIMMSIYGQSRIFYAIARDGLLPSALAKLHPVHGNPRATICVFTFAIALIAAFCPFNIISKLSSIGSLIGYSIVAVIVLIFRFTMPNEQRPFKCPMIYIIAPTALITSLFLLSKQIFRNGKITDTGDILICWLLGTILLYFIALVIKKIYNKIKLKSG